MSMRLNKTVLFQNRKGLDGKDEQESDRRKLGWNPETRRTEKK